MRTMKIRTIAMTFALAAAAAAALPADAQVYISRVVSRGWLGITVDESITSSNGRQTQSVVITNVMDESPAKRAGVQAGDTLLRVNDLRASSELIRSMGASVNPGDTVRFIVKRNGREREIRIEAAEVPASARMSYGIRERDGQQYFSLDPDSVRGMLRIFTDSLGVHGKNFEILKFDSAMGHMRTLLGADTMVFRSMLPSYAFEFGDGRGFDFKGKFDTLTFRPGIFKYDSLMMRMDSLGGFTPRVFGFSDTFEPGMNNGNFTFMMARNSFAGAALVNVDGNLGAYFGAKSGILVTEVPDGTPAERAGLEPGDVITKIDGATVTNVSELNRAVAKSKRGAPIKLQILRHQKPYSLELKRE